MLDRGMATPLLLPKLELPAVLDALEAHLVVAPEQIELWNTLVCERHYLSDANLVGQRLRYVLSYQGQWVALLGWSAAFSFTSKTVKGGWDGPIFQRRSRLHLLAQNSRFVVLVNRTQWPNLASRSLGLVCQRLSQDSGTKLMATRLRRSRASWTVNCFAAPLTKPPGWKLLGADRWVRARGRGFLYPPRSAQATLGQVAGCGRSGAFVRRRVAPTLAGP